MDTRCWPFEMSGIKASVIGSLISGSAVPIAVATPVLVAGCLFWVGVKSESDPIMGLTGAH